jgi:hypothetical protein
LNKELNKHCKNLDNKINNIKIKHNNKAETNQNKEVLQNKEHFYIYLYKQNNTLTDEKKPTKTIIAINEYYSTWPYNTQTHPHRTTHAYAHTNTLKPTLPRDISSSTLFAHNIKTRPHIHDQHNIDMAKYESLAANIMGTNIVSKNPFIFKKIFFKY